MPQLEWRKQLELNYPPLDDEHKAFLAVVNKARKAVEDADFTVVDMIFEACYDYARNHFSHEESIMERISFPDLPAHMKSHRMFIKHISEMRQLYMVAPSDKEKLDIATKMANFLQVWLLGHILSRDKIIKPYLVRLRNMPPKMNY